MPHGKKCLLKNVPFFQLVKMLYFKYIQSKLQYTTSQSITTLQVHIPTSEAFSFFFSLESYSGQWLSKIYSLLSILPSCAKVLKFLLQGFAASSHSFGWLLTPGFHHCNCLVSLVITSIFLQILSGL